MIKITNQKLIIIRGNSGSGKSTVAKKLQYKMGHTTMLIPQDVVRREMLRVKDGEQNASIQLIYEMAMYGKSVNHSVIIEGILTEKWYGDMLRKLIQDFGRSNFVYYLDIPFRETLRRHALKPNAHEFGEKEMKKWWVEKDYLNTSNEKLMDESLSEDEVTDLIYQEVS